MFPNQIIKYLKTSQIKLSGNELASLFLLVSLDVRKTGVYATKETIVAGTSIGVRSLQRHLAKLAALGLIAIQKRKGTSDLITILIYSQQAPAKLAKEAGQNRQDTPAKMADKKITLNNKVTSIPPIISEKLKNDGIDIKQIESLVLSKKITIREAAVQELYWVDKRL